MPNGNTKKARVAILISGKMNLKNPQKRKTKSALYNDKGINRRRGYCTP